MFFISLDSIFSSCKGISTPNCGEWCSISYKCVFKAEKTNAEEGFSESSEE